MAWDGGRRAVDRAVDGIRLHGLGRALAMAPRWLVRREYLVLARDLTTPLPALPPEPVRWSALGVNHLAALRALDPDLSEDEIRRRWREGQHTEGGWDGDRLVYARWETRGPTYLPYLGCVLRPSPTDLLVVEQFTHFLARGRGIATAASLRSLHRAREAGCRRSLALVAWWNEPALRVTRDHMGRRIMGTVGFWNLGITRHYFATGEPRVGPHGVSVGH